MFIQFSVINRGINRGIYCVVYTVNTSIDLNTMETCHLTTTRQNFASVAGKLKGVFMPPV